MKTAGKFSATRWIRVFQSDRNNYVILRYIDYKTVFTKSQLYDNVKFYKEN